MSRRATAILLLAAVGTGQATFLKRGPLRSIIEEVAVYEIP